MKNNYDITNNDNWFRTAKKGIMIHWGLYSYFGGEYNGKQCDNYAEWIQSYFKIPNKTLEKIASIFNPLKFNADNLASFAKEHGYKYIIFTAKHHEGFAMFHSKIDKYNVVDASPYHRDILMDLANACKKFGIKLGIYYSQDIDWHERNGGGFKTPVENCAGSSWDNNWDYKDKNKDFDEYFYSKSLPQIKELMTNYGEIAVAWFDMPLTLTIKQSKEIYDVVKKYQPNCLINSRLGNGFYDYVSFGDNEIPDSVKELNNCTNFNDINGLKPSPKNLYECCCTLNQSWGFTKHPKWKDISTLKEDMKKANKIGANFLINIGIDFDGNIPDKALELLSNL